jgi:hypothetical protein
MVNYFQVIVAYNSLGWNRTDIIKIPVSTRHILLPLLLSYKRHLGFTTQVSKKHTEKPITKQDSKSSKDLIYKNMNLMSKCNACTEN